MAILPLLQKLSFHVPGLSEKKRKNMERRLAFHEWTKGFRRFFRRPFVFLFGSPFHSNLGDQAQTECIYCLDQEKSAPARNIHCHLHEYLPEASEDDTQAYPEK